MRMNPKSHLITEPNRTRRFISIGLLLLSGVCFSLSTLIANMAFKDGINLITSNAMRYCVATVLLIIYQKISDKKIRLLPRERSISFALGIPVFMMGIGYLGATQYIPISLAVLIFYTGPFFVVIISRFTEDEPITIMRLAAFIIAFTGLSLALQVQSIAALHILGIIFALLAAMGFAGFVTVSSLMLQTADRQTVLLHSFAAATLLFMLSFVLAGGVETAVTRLGWLKVGASGIMVAIAYITFFAGMEIAGPVKASMILNIEPVLTILLAAISLGERLSNTQLSGAVLVIWGIVLITLTPKKRL